MLQIIMIVFSINVVEIFLHMEFQMQRVKVFHELGDMIQQHDYVPLYVMQIIRGMVIVVKQIHKM